jgi:lincosamide nucleotidyltransferase A/C/D/E
MRLCEARQVSDHAAVMSEASAGELCRMLDRGRIRCWIVGGWGVDALLGRCTRPHKDLDVLLVLSQHGDAWQLLHERGFRLAYRWEENVDVPGALVDGAAQPTAYVLADESGRQVDVHVLDDRPPEMTPLWSTDRLLIPGALTARGTIDGRPVRCMSARMQLLAHEGYELPSEQRADVAKLRQLLGPDRTMMYDARGTAPDPGDQTAG